MTDYDRFDRFTPKRPICGHVMHVTPARLVSRRGGEPQEGLNVDAPRTQRDDSQGIKTIAFLVAFAQYTVLSKPMQTRTTLASKVLYDSDLESRTRKCVSHDDPTHRKRQSSRKQSRRRCWQQSWSTTRSSGVEGGMVRSYNLKSTLPSSSTVVLLSSTFPNASYSTGRSALLSP
jgi:hypothetical protein